MPVLRQFDLLLLALALPVFLIAGLPMLGYAVAAGVWLAARGIELLLARRVAGALERGDRRTALGTTAVSGLSRVWLIALAVLLVGLSDHEAGLAAALLSLLLFSVHMATRVLSNLLAGGGAEAR
jgi:hypothetical protein